MTRSRRDRDEDLLVAAEQFFARKGAPRPEQGIYGSYAALLALRGDEPGLAACFRAILPERVKDGRDQPPNGRNYGFDLLISFLNLYHKYRSALDDGADGHFKQVLREACAPQGRIHLYDFGFANTNHPLKAAVIQVLAGDLLDDEEIGRSGLEKLRGVFRKLAVGAGSPYSSGGYFGAVSEFNSPTYAAPQLIAAALLANHARHTEAQAIGLLLQELILMDILTHWHPPTQQSAAPHSRGYTENTLGGTSLVKYILHAILPDGVFFDTETGWWARHANDIANAVQAVAVDFHTPDYLIDLALSNVYPRATRMKTSTYGYSFGLWSYPSGPIDTYSHQSRTFTLGSSSRAVGTGGQTDSPAIKWCKREPVERMSDHRVAFFRYREDASYTFQQSSIHDQGIKNVLQWENAAVALYRPRPFAGQGGGGVSDLRLDLCIPLYEPLDALYVGGERVATSSMSSVSSVSSESSESPVSSATHATYDVPQTVVIQDGSVVIGLRPLVVTDLGRKHAMTLSERDGVLVISLVNYAGPKHSFPAETLLQVCNGWVIIVEEARSGLTPEGMMARLDSAALRDELSGDLVRSVAFDDGWTTLEARLPHLGVEFEERRVGGEPFAPVIFSSALIGTAAKGEVHVGDAVLRNRSATPLRLLASPDGATCVVYNFYPESAEFSLSTPAGTVGEGRLGTGRVVYRWVEGNWTSERLDVRGS